MIGPNLNIIMITPTINMANRAMAGYRTKKTILICLWVCKFKCHFRFCAIQRIPGDDDGVVAVGGVVVVDDVVDCIQYGFGATENIHFIIN